MKWLPGTAFPADEPALRTMESKYSDDGVSLIVTKTGEYLVLPPSAARALAVDLFQRAAHVDRHPIAIDHIPQATHSSRFPGTGVAIEPTEPGNRFVELWPYVGGHDRHSVFFDATRVRAFAADLLARADLIDPPIPETGA